MKRFIITIFIIMVGLSCRSITHGFQVVQRNTRITRNGIHSIMYPATAAAAVSTSSRNCAISTRTAIHNRSYVSSARTVLLPFPTAAPLSRSHTAAAAVTTTLSRLFLFPYYHDSSWCCYDGYYNKKNLLKSHFTTSITTPRIRSNKSSITSTSSSIVTGTYTYTDKRNTARFTTLGSQDNDQDHHKDTEKARILFLGTPDVAATSLQRLVSESQKESTPYQIIGVVTQPPKRRQRRGKEVPSPVGMVAQECNLPVLTPEKAKDDDFLTELEHVYRPDLCITAAYGQYLPKRFLKIPKFGTLNIHPSLLPRWRGASPVQRSLEAGDNPVGVSVLFTVSKMDAGPIVKQQELEIDENDNATKLLPLLFDMGTDMLLQVLPDVIQGKITMENAMPQEEDQVVNADMIDSSEGELCVWKDSARVCHNKVRGFSMWPGTFLHVEIVGNDQDPQDDSTRELVKMKVLESRVLLQNEAGDNNLVTTDEIVLGPNKGDGLRVVCGDGSVLELITVQPVTRKAMDAKSFVNGLRGKKLKWVNMSSSNASEVVPS